MKKLVQVFVVITVCLIMSVMSCYISQEVFVHDVQETRLEEQEDNNTNLEKAYGRIEPVIADEENEYVKIVKKVEDYEGNVLAHIYEKDYNGDGETEAFVVIGKEWENTIFGDLWFVDSEEEAVFIQRGNIYREYQEYIRENNITYLFLYYNLGNPWITDIYTVSKKKPFIIAESDCRQKILDNKGQVIQWQDAYDVYCELGYEDFEEGFWTGHTYKPYTFIFEKGELIEIPAKEISLEDVESVASLPADYDKGMEKSAKQYILRENGELNINMAIQDDIGLRFEYVTFRLNENSEWTYMERGKGFYKIQLSGESSWDYLDTYLRQQ